MCDLKRTLDATVWPLIETNKRYGSEKHTGSLCPGNAFRNWKDRIPPLSNRFLPTSTFSHT
jgi:hypothetical protein